ncbi:MAG: DUF11 domain-containing protein [Sphingopyxis sp.]|nr:DUF11 domain-containing protein [Sphingopyxis sp.]
MIGAAFAAASLVLFAPDPASAQLRSLENPSFEQNDPQGPGAPNWEILPDTSVPGWATTTNEIELWDSNFNGVPAFSGLVFAEMNANVNGTFFQNICLVNGEPISWTFAHRARSGGQATQTVRFQVANSSGTLLQNLATQSSLTSNQIWNVNNGTTTYTGPTGLQRVQFTTSDPGSVGNFLDAIQLMLRPFIQLSAAGSTSVESVPSAGLATLLVTGTATSAISVTVTITGGTAVRGTDYTTPGGGASFTVTVPAGTYFNTPVPLGISVIDDSVIEGSETITYAVSGGTGYTLGHTTSCGSPVQSTATYTITDNDARVTLRKQWANAATGDDATVTIARGATVIDSLLSDAGTANELDTDATPTPVVIGETLTLAETLAGTNVGRYLGALACTGTADANLANGLTVGAGETAIVCTYTNTRIADLLVDKSSTIISDGVNASNPKAIPGAVIRYCISVTNPGTLPATDIYVADILPVLMTYITGSARTGPSCATATTVEDDDAAGTDENDPHGASFNGTSLLGFTTSLGAGATFALAFNMLLN